MKTKRHELDQSLVNPLFANIKLQTETLLQSITDEEKKEKIVTVLYEAFAATLDYLRLVENHCTDVPELTQRFSDACLAVQELNWLIYQPNSVPEHMCVIAATIPMALISMLFFGFIRSVQGLYEHLVSTIELSGALIGAIAGFGVGLVEGGIQGYMLACRFNRTFFSPAEHQVNLANIYKQLNSTLENPSAESTILQPS